MKCRKCRTQAKDGDMFCSVCGNKLIFKCDNCGSIVDENDAYCRKCGSALRQTNAFIISIDVAKNLSHRINNALAIILTSSQIALKISKNLYGNLGAELQSLLNDIAESAENSGILVHQFQEYINAIENDDPKDEIENLADKIINYPKFEPIKRKTKDDDTIMDVIEEKPKKSKQISVLIIDDEDRIRQTMSYAISLSGHNVITASNGQEAIEHIQKRFYNIAFVDLVLPDMDGWQIIDIIKQRSPNTITVLMTGWNVKIDDNEVLSKNVDAMLSKPFQLSDVSELIKNI
ncbi:MAG: response regulator [Candidatus Poribacteria bacterium]